MSTQNAEPLPYVDLDRERRLARVAGLFAIAAVLCTLAAVPVASTDVVDRPGDANDLSFLESVGLSGGGQFAAVMLRLASVLVLIPVAYFILKACRGRDPASSRWIFVLGVVSFLVVGFTTVLGFLEVRDVAREFVESGPRTLPRAEDTLEAARDRGALRLANLGGIFGGVLFGLWISLSSFELMKVGMLTRFLGIFGLGAGITTAIGIPVAPSMFLGWVGSLGILALGWWPGGRPRAWEEGRAVSWDEADGKVPPPPPRPEPAA